MPRRLWRNKRRRGAVHIPAEYDIEEMLLTGERVDEIAWDSNSMRELCKIWIERRDELMEKLRQENRRGSLPWAAKKYGLNVTMEDVEGRRF